MLPVGHLCSGGINQRAAVGMGPPRFSSEGPHRHTAAQGGDPQVSPAAAPTTAPANWLAPCPPAPFISPGSSARATYSHRPLVSGSSLLSPGEGPAETVPSLCSGTLAFQELLKQDSGSHVGEAKFMTRSGVRGLTKFHEQFRGWWLAGRVTGGQACPAS